MTKSPRKKTSRKKRVDYHKDSSIRARGTTRGGMGPLWLLRQQAQRLVFLKT